MCFEPHHARVAEEVVQIRRERALDVLPMAEAGGFCCRSRDTQRFLLRSIFRHSTGYPGASRPSENILRRVRVSVACVTTCDTYERGLSHAVVRADVTAGVACAGRVAWIDEQQRSPKPIELVPDLSAQFAPSLIQDTPIESRLRPDVPPRLLSGPCSARSHVRDSEVFHYDNRVAFADRRAGLVYLVFADIRYLRMHR